MKRLFYQRDEELYDEAEENHNNNSHPEQCESAITDQQRPHELFELSGVDNCSFKSVPAPLADLVHMDETRDETNPGIRECSMVLLTENSVPNPAEISHESTDPSEGEFIPANPILHEVMEMSARHAGK